MNFVVQDIIVQFVMGLVICAIFVGIWKIGHKNEKL